MTGSGQKMLEAGLALGVFVAIIAAIGDTSLYPLAFGIVGIAWLHTLLQHPTAINKPVQWASSKLA